MAGQINIAGNNASVNLQGNDTITTDQVFTFPATGGTLLVSDSNIGLWERTDTTIRPADDGDSVSIGGTTATPNIALNADGGADFCGGDLVLSDEGIYGSKYIVYRDEASIAMSVRSTQDRNNDVISFYGNGKANFIGTVESFTYDQTSNSTGGGYSLQAFPLGGGWGGSMRVQNLAGGNNYNAFMVWNGNTPAASWRQDGTLDIGGTLVGGGASHQPNITLNSDGTADFVGQVSSGDEGSGSGSTATGTGGVALTNYGAIDAWWPTATAQTQIVLRSDYQEVRTSQFQVNTQGQIYAKSTSILALSSERRLKENIALMDPTVSWDTIKNTPYYAYNFIGTPIEDVKFGPMADEVPAEMKLATDQSDDVGVIHTYDNAMLQARLYTALQTALTRIETLEARLAAAGL